MKRLTNAWSPTVNWMRPLIRRSSSYRQRNVAVADASTASGPPPVVRVKSLAPLRQGGEVARRRAAIPTPLTAAYTVAPQSRVAASAGGGGGGRSAETVKLRELKKKLGSTKSRTC
jgi:hypothetical protein